jgi:hypothetical protein
MELTFKNVGFGSGIPKKLITDPEVIGIQWDDSGSGPDLVQAVPLFPYPLSLTPPPLPLQRSQELGQPGLGPGLLPLPGPPPGRVCKGPWAMD